MKSILSYIYLTFLFINTTWANNKIQVWTDEKGVKHFEEYPEFAIDDTQINHSFEELKNKLEKIINEQPNKHNLQKYLTPLHQDMTPNEVRKTWESPKLGFFGEAKDRNMQKLGTQEVLSYPIGIILYFRDNKLIGWSTKIQGKGIIQSEPQKSNIQPRPQSSRETLRYYTKNHLNMKFIPVTINNIPLDAIIDTGASYVSLNANSIRQLNIKTFIKEITINTANNITKGYLFIANSIKVGNIELNNIQCVYIPTSKENLLGGSFLSNFNYSFNEQEHTIRFIRKKELMQNDSLQPYPERKTIGYRNLIKKEPQLQETIQHNKEFIKHIDIDSQPQKTAQQNQSLPITKYYPNHKPINPSTSTTQKTNYLSIFQKSPILFTYFIIAIPLHFIIIWVLVLAEILKSEFTGSNKTVWVLIVILLPLIGLILYWTIGKKQKIDPALNIDNINAVRKYTRLKL